jgi:hypothetical protein
MAGETRQGEHETRAKREWVVLVLPHQGVGDWRNHSRAPAERLRQNGRQLSVGGSDGRGKVWSPKRFVANADTATQSSRHARGREVRETIGNQAVTWFSGGKGATRVISTVGGFDSRRRHYSCNSESLCLSWCGFHATRQRPIAGEGYSGQLGRRQGIQREYTSDVRRVEAPRPSHSPTVGDHRLGV